jgi:2-polyprenyl-3-methyl-5-hydroxy-6-metoxy-1,4-benzoquinol methylase
MNHNNPNQLPLIDLPAIDFIKDFAAQLALREEVSLNMLDIGCGTGRHARYLSQLGHNVIGVSNVMAEVEDARRFAQDARVDGRNHYIVGDARSLMFNQPFDVVLTNEMLHKVTKLQSKKILTAGAELVRPGGYHVVSGYMVDAGVQTALMHMRLMQPGELASTYPSRDWKILNYHESVGHSYMYNNQDILNSRAMIVAQKRG